jgi:hypothetical protein
MDFRTGKFLVPEFSPPHHQVTCFLNISSGYQELRCLRTGL